MASKLQCRNAVKDKNSKFNPKASQNAFVDEIALRDEIFELKREILLLKKANERNLIKVRKYEGEAKKKDRQIEELMDPVKNGDVRKLLSTKGAALLLNLKEQNNALIQMVLAKDMQIRKLLSEIKTSKLYASTKRAESYRHEIDRLRNLLIKSQNMVKESQDMHQRRSVCASGASVQQTTLSSEQSSPRDLEELQFTIQSLELHMKYSNELLAKKNEQIAQLIDQLNSYQCSTCRKTTRPKFFIESNLNTVPDTTLKTSERDFLTRGESIIISSTFDTLHNSKFFINDYDQDFHESKLVSATYVPGKDFQDCDDAPTSNSTSTSKQDTTPAHSRQECYERNLFDNKMNLIRNAKSNSCMNEAKIEPTKHFTPGNSGISSLHRILERTNGNSEQTEEESEVDTEEFEMMEKKIENDQTEIESPLKMSPQANGQSHHSALDKFLSDEKLFLVQTDKGDSEGDTALVLEQTNEELDGNVEDEERDEKLWKADFELENANGHEKDCKGNNCGPFQTGCVVEGLETRNSESIWNSYQYSSDSSFDSQITAGNTMEVKAEINHNSELDDHTLVIQNTNHTKSESSDDEHEVIANKTSNETYSNEDDDDDVITG